MMKSLIKVDGKEILLTCSNTSMFGEASIEYERKIVAKMALQESELGRKWVLTIQKKGKENSDVSVLGSLSRDTGDFELIDNYDIKGSKKKDAFNFFCGRIEKVFTGEIEKEKDGKNLIKSYDSITQKIKEMTK